MKSFPPARIRNVALVGHGGAGKTTLAEALLFCAGAITRQGRVEDGTTTCDFDPEEVKRRISVSVALAPFEWEDHKINLLDCPGYADFASDAIAALRVADLAVFVVSAVEGVEVQTELMWKVAAALGLPRMIFVNKLDRERASFERTLDQLQQTFGAGIAPLELPIGEEAAFRGVADLLSDTAITYDGAKASTGAIPDDMEAQEKAVHESLVEGIVVGDDDLMERYLEGRHAERRRAGEDPGQRRRLGPGVPRDLRVGGQGHRRRPAGHLHLRDRTLPGRAAGRDRQGGRQGHRGRAAIPPASRWPWCSRPWPTPTSGKISMFKVLSGTIRPDIVLTNPRTHGDERLHALFTLRGKEQVQVSDVPAGDIGAVAKLGDTTTGDTLAPKGTPVIVPLAAGSVQVLSVAIKPKSKGDEDKLMTALHRLQEEDPALSVSRNDETHQTLLGGMGETHLAIATERLLRKFGVEVETEEVIVAYRETITTKAEAEGKYKKQTGGHGQFGVAFLRVEPLERGSGFQFSDEIVGGAIPRQFIPAVQKGIEETMATGGVFGYPVVDVKATCYDGKYHPVDSSEMSFKMAGSLGFQGGHGQGRSGTARADLTARGDGADGVPG